MKRRRSGEDIFRFYLKYRSSESEIAHIVGWELFDAEQILITLDDGSKIFYDHAAGAVRCLSPEYLDRELTEEEWRREFMFHFRDKVKRFGGGQKALSDKTGIPQSILSSYANGRAIPNFYNASRIADGLGCSVEELLRFPGRD